jgi:hypothetical protein
MYIIGISIVIKEYQIETHRSTITMNEEMHKNQSQIIEIYLHIVVINTTKFHHPLIQIHRLSSILLIPTTISRR